MKPVRLRSILCPIDFSEPSREAVRYAADLARRTGGHLSVLFVNDRLLLVAAVAAFHRRPLFLRRTQTELERFVKESIRTGQVPRGGIACNVAEGDPAGEILNEARRLKSDLIVMGTHGLKGLDKLFFGSTTEQVLRRVKVPVLAIPPAKTPRRWSRTPLATASPIARVVVPVDPDGTWEHELNGAAAAARWYEADLMLVHVVPRTQAPPWLRLNVAASDRARVAKARQALEQIRAKVPADITSACRVLLGDPANEIAAVAANGPASLIVMGLRHGVRARLGSTTQHVLTHAVAPVLALPRPA